MLLQQIPVLPCSHEVHKEEVGTRGGVSRSDTGPGWGFPPSKQQGFEGQIQNQCLGRNYYMGVQQSGSQSTSYQPSRTALSPEYGEFSILVASSEVHSLPEQTQTYWDVPAP